MKNVMNPPLWLLALIIGLTQLSETIYSPALPSIAKEFAVEAYLVEHTLTIYLFGFAIGTIFWGCVSDYIGRKPCILLGLCIFVLGTYYCFISQNINALMMSRLLQSFGGSIGSVIGQAICRDAFKGKRLTEVYAVISASLGVWPAIGPIIGGIVTEHYHWSKNFILLGILGIVLLFFSIIKLSETHKQKATDPKQILIIMKTIFRDKFVLYSGYLVAGCNGIIFSYYSEGPFYLLSILGLDPTDFGITFILISLGALAGGFLARRLNKEIEPLKITLIGLNVVLFSTLMFSIIILLYSYSHIKISNNIISLIAVISQMLNLLGITMVTSSILSVSLKNYQHCIGIASSIFGFYYYMLICIFLFGMAYLHSCSLLTMPLYFLAITLSMFVTYKKL